MTKPKRGLLLVNLGTPESPTPKGLRKYLKEFLSDPRVVDIPYPARMVLLYAIILPFRPKESAKAYQSIWEAEGSPLLIHSHNLVKKVQEKIADTYQVSLGMRYGQPSIPSALEQLKDCEQILVLPLFPQYSSAANGSAIEAVLSTIKTYEIQPHLTIIRDFYDAPAYIHPLADIIKANMGDAEHIIFSYHGLPERQLIKGGCDKVCDGPCPDPKDHIPGCYRAQCFATTRALVAQLDLQPDQFSTTFQSRLGKTPWIQPYTDEVIPELAKKGVKKLAVVCPAFTADCVETLEEIGIRAKEQWLECGGESLTLIPCVNADDQWVNGLVDMVNKHTT